MRAIPLLVAVFGLSVVTGCSQAADRVGGEAGPAGAPAATMTTAAAAAPTSPAAAGSPSTVAAGRTSEIRRTDWPNVTLRRLGFQGIGDATFRNGEADLGLNRCRMLPGDARPVYAEFLTEEPANSPVTEDALVLVECGGEQLQQALVPVQLGFDQKTREPYGFIPADPSTGPGSRMTFTSYRVDNEVIHTTVKKADGSTETRKYRHGSGTAWERF